MVTTIAYLPLRPNWRGGMCRAAIYATDVPSAFAAKAATETIPIVFVVGADPIKVGLVDSLSRPKGNVTGMSAFLSALGPKRVELLHELLPTSDTIALPRTLSS